MRDLAIRPPNPLVARSENIFAPFEQLINNHFNEIFSDNFWSSAPRTLKNIAKHSDFPKYDSYYKGDKFIMEFAVPGMNQDCLQLEVISGTEEDRHANVLKISGKSESISEDTVFQIRELKRSAFTRHVPLPDNIEGDPEAVYENGILEVSWNVVQEKKEIPKIKKIEIK